MNKNLLQGLASLIDYFHVQDNERLKFERAFRVSVQNSDRHARSGDRSGTNAFLALALQGRMTLFWRPELA